MSGAPFSPIALQCFTVENTSPPSTAHRQVKSETLLQGAQELRIDHHGQEYRLRQTRNGKLILTK